MHGWEYEERRDTGMHQFNLFTPPKCIIYEKIKLKSHLAQKNNLDMFSYLPL